MGIKDYTRTKIKIITCMLGPGIIRLSILIVDVFDLYFFIINITYLNDISRSRLFREEPASSGYEWHFPPNHNSSADFSTSVGSISKPLV